MIINLGDAPFKGFIKVTYPNGTCTVSLGDKSFTHTGGGTHTFTVNKKGTWTVKATSNDGYNLTAQSTAALTYRGQVANVTLSYALWLYNKGDLCSAVTGGWNSNKWQTSWYSRTGTMTKNANSITLSGQSWGTLDTSPRQAIEAITQNKINLSGYSTLFINVLSSPSSSAAADTLLSVKDSYAASPSSSVKLQLAGAGTGLLSLDVSAITGSYYVSVSLGAGAAGTHTTIFDEVYLR